MKVIGVLGGMGPAATLDFMAKVYAADSAQSFDSLPPNLYGQPITVKFNGQAACARG